MAVYSLQAGWLVGWSDLLYVVSNWMGGLMFRQPVCLLDLCPCVQVSLSKTLKHDLLLTSDPCGYMQFCIIGQRGEIIFSLECVWYDVWGVLKILFACFTKWQVAHFSLFWLCTAAHWIWNETLTMRSKTRLSALILRLFASIFGQQRGTLSIRTMILNTQKKNSHLTQSNWSCFTFHFFFFEYWGARGQLNMQKVKPGRSSPVCLLVYLIWRFQHTHIIA